jgi:hypothetical protein
LIVNVNAEPPVVAAFGLRLVIVRALTVKTTPLEAPPPGFTTVTLAVPALAMRPAGTVAVNCVALTNVVESSDPFHCTVELLTNPAPFTVSVNADPPVVAAFGLTLVMVRALTMKLTPLEVPPPGFRTVMVAVPAEAIKPAETAAFNCVPLTNVVDSDTPFQRTVEPLTYPAPLTVNVNAGPPTVAAFGFKLVIVSVLTVNVTPLDMPPPGFTTVRVAVPAEAIRLAGTVAVTCVVLRKVVDSADPFHCTVEPLTYPAPLTVSVNAGPPAVATFGFKLVIVSALTVNVTPLDVPPPGFTVVMVAVPAEAIKPAETVVFNCVPLTNVVGSDAPFQRTVEPLTNPDPFTVSVKAPPPAVARFGLRLVMVSALTVNVTPLEVPPPGFTTITVAVPALAIRLAATEAVNWPLFT